jgi:hypothetical protein
VNGIVKPALMPIEAQRGDFQREFMENRKHSIVNAIRHTQLSRCARCGGVARVFRHDTADTCPALSRGQKNKTYSR